MAVAVDVASSSLGWTRRARSAACELEMCASHCRLRRRNTALGRKLEQCGMRRVTCQCGELVRGGTDRKGVTSGKVDMFVDERIVERV